MIRNYKKMLQAAIEIVHYYKSFAPSLAKTYGVIYQVDLERMMIIQLEELSNSDIK